MRAFWLGFVALGLGAKRHWHILFAIILGIVLGLVFPLAPGETPHFIHQAFAVVAEVFIRLITMIVIPLVVSSLIVGVSSLGDSRQLGRMGGKVLSYFLLFMAISSILGGALVLAFEPGHLLQAEVRNFAGVTPEHLAELQVTTPDLKDLFFNMIPTNPLEALATGRMLPVIVFTLIFGVAIASIGDAGKPILSFFEALFTATMKMTDWIMMLAVPGVFALAFGTVSHAGLGIFIQLLPYVGVLVMGLLIQILVIFPLFLKVVARIRVTNLYRAISEAIMVAFGTASSSATLPITIACCERRAGISNRIASFVLPTGATINKTGTTMFESILVIFLAQAYGLELTGYSIAVILVFAMVASIGTAGVPSGGLITVAIVFSSIGKYDMATFAGGLAMVWSIDRVLDMCRTVVNVISSCTVATLVAASEGELNRDVLNNQDTWAEVV